MIHSNLVKYAWDVERKYIQRTTRCTQLGCVSVKYILVHIIDSILSFAIATSDLDMSMKLIWIHRTINQRDWSAEVKTVSWDELVI